MGVLTKAISAWNAFRSYDPYQMPPDSIGISYARDPQQRPRRYSTERSIIASIYTRISIDVADILFQHVEVDDKDRYSKRIKSKLNDALLFSPNMDQGPRAFRQDICESLLEDGAAAIVPVDTTIDPNTNEIFDIITLRVGNICNWYPQHVKVRLYNEAKGIREEVVLEKRFVGIVYNPFYSVMNQANSTLQRLIKKLNLLDVVDDQSSSGKLDIIIQLPYTIKSETRREQAEKRREDIEFQLKGSQYGIAYADATEKITQLNRPAENNLLAQVEYLTNLLYDELGLTKAVMDGSADEKVMLNYHNRTIKPIAEAIKEAMQRTFIGPVGVDNNERIHFFNDPFKLVPVAQLAEFADKFSRNEIVSANEVRNWLGLPPSDDPKADMLVNSNMPQPGLVNSNAPIPSDPNSPSPANTNAQQSPANSNGNAQLVQGAFDDINKTLDGVFADLGSPNGG